MKIHFSIEPDSNEKLYGKETIFESILKTSQNLIFNITFEIYQEKIIRDKIS